MKDIENKLFLIQTDTTVGFLSKNSDLLKNRKQRPFGKEFLKVVSSFKDLKSFVRVPNKLKRFIRKSKKSTFIYSNLKSVRVVKDGEHNIFLKDNSAFFSSSANISGEKFHRETAINLADILCENKRGFSEKTPSKIFKIRKEKINKIR